MPAKLATATLALLLVIAAPAPAAIVVNEAESSGIFDYIELTNTGGAAVDISGYILKDSNDNRTLAVPAGTTLAAGGYFVQRVDDPLAGGNFGLGEADSARVFTPGNAFVDGFDWTAESPTTWGRCPNGTGTVQITSKPSPGVANTCPAPIVASAWPGGTSIATGDVAGAVANNMSGLAYQPSGTAARGTLWAIRNSSGIVLSTLFKLTYDGTTWVDSAGWVGGKQLFYATGAGNPDTEGVTLAGGEPNVVYAAVERDGSGRQRPARPALRRLGARCDADRFARVEPEADPRRARAQSGAGGDRVGARRGARRQGAAGRDHRRQVQAGELPRARLRAVLRGHRAGRLDRRLRAHARQRAGQGHAVRERVRQRAGPRVRGRDQAALGGV